MYVCNLYFLEQKGIFIHKITAMKNHKKIKLKTSKCHKQLQRKGE